MISNEDSEDIVTDYNYRHSLYRKRQNYLYERDGTLEQLQDENVVVEDFGVTDYSIGKIVAW